MEAWPVVQLNPDNNISLDAGATWLLPGDVWTRYIPVSVNADGNCFYRSLSLLATGSEEHRVELHVRMTVDVVINEKLYTDNWNRYSPEACFQLQ